MNPDEIPLIPGLILAACLWAVVVYQSRKANR
jgi:hypothetical protein